jgi:hypothetical protein
MVKTFFCSNSNSRCCDGAPVLPLALEVVVVMVAAKECGINRGSHFACCRTGIETRKLGDVRSLSELSVCGTLAAQRSSYSGPSGCLPLFRHVRTTQRRRWRRGFLGHGRWLRHARRRHGRQSAPFLSIAGPDAPQSSQRWLGGLYVGTRGRWTAWFGRYGGSR